jgi:hypothetical protein
MGGASFT